MPSNSLVRNYHEVTLGGGTVTLLSTDGHDWFPDGEEPKFSHAQAMDSPDVSGLDNGIIYARGNLRWEATITRVREFINFTYPVTDGSITADTPEEYAQKWLLRHLDQVAGANGSSLTINGRVWATSVVQPQGTTDNFFVEITYQLNMADAN